MKGILYYDSKYGSTRTVCEWIASAIDLFQTDIKNVKDSPFVDCDFYIIGTPVFIGKPMQSVIDFIYNNKNKFLEKRVFLFTASWAESTVYRNECKRFLDLLQSYLSPSVPVLSKSLPGKLIMDEISDNDRKVMRRLLRRIDNMSQEFHSDKIIFKDQRSKDLSTAFGKEIQNVLFKNE